jgi:hypothetical protein
MRIEITATRPDQTVQGAMWIKAARGVDKDQMEPVLLNGKPELQITLSQRHAGFVEWAIDRIHAGHFDDITLDHWRNEVALKRETA